MANQAEEIEIEPAHLSAKSSEENILQLIVDIWQENEKYIQYIGLKKNEVIILNKTKLRENAFGIEEPTIETYPITKQTLIDLNKLTEK